MSAKLRHFAINAEDVERAKRFYEDAFGWTFNPWGPPDFYQTQDAGNGVWAAIHGRREIEPGARMVGVEATLAVDDIGATIKAVEAAGGHVLGPPFHIQTVGRLIWFRDPEGNILGAMQYDNP
ncbi:MAG TPA: VOC family protein [Caulobacteraceae bacterium]|jgi:hypothetical protein|nr:VOC family protein [Caulobacteraceae bacterium]